MKKRIPRLIALASVLTTSPVCLGQGAKPKPNAVAKTPTHIMIAPDEVKWGAPPEALVSGTPSVAPGGELRYAKIQGDPTKPGVPFTISLNCTDGYKVAPHWHPTSENIVVLKGTLALAMGDKFDPSALHDMRTGTYGYMPARVHHFGQCKGETSLLVYGIGPFKINWLSSTELTPKKTAGDK